MAAVAQTELPNADSLPALHGSVVGQKATYSLDQVLGDGGYGTVFLTNRQGRSYALKVEKYSKSMLFIEAGVLKAANAANLHHFCTMVDGGSYQKQYVFIVMTLLYKDLHRLRSEQPDRRFSLSTGIRIGIQTLQAIKELHSINFINRDIKPGNFAPGHRVNDDHRNIIMFDFGLARRYINKENGQVLPPRGEVGWRGTTRRSGHPHVRYGSLVAHKKQDLSRRDDVESWFYLLVEVTAGCLPWRLVTDRVQVATAKQNARTENRASFLSNCPSCYSDILTDIDKLTFHTKPNYDVYLEKLKKACSERGIRMHDHFDWDEESSLRHTETATAGELSVSSDNAHMNPTQTRSYM